MSIARRVFPGCALASLAVAVAFAAGCGSTASDGQGAANGGGPSAIFGVSGGDGGDDGSANLPRCIVATGQCVASCSGSTSTTVSGTVYDPAGRNPLYGIVVFVPSVPPAALPQGVDCLSCSALYDSGLPIAYTVTDAAGNFTLTGVPDGANIPLVVQVGKWRMQYTLPSVSKCADNDAKTATTKIAAPSVLRLPKNHTEGDIPNMAIATGGADSLECLLSRIGVDKTEYVAGPGGTGRIHIFQGDGGANTTPAAPIASQGLWPNNTATAVMDFSPYDITLLTCEGHETTGGDVGGGGLGGRGGGGGGGGGLSAMQQQALFNYAAAGGRVFASHYHYAWFNTGPFAAVTPPLATWTPGTNDMGDIDAIVEQTLPGGAAFPRGMAMDQWLTNVNALTNGELPIQEARHNADVGVANTLSTPWIVADSKAHPAGATEYFSFDTPIGVAPAEQCGRVVYSDLHVGAASGDYGQKPGDTAIPMGAMTPSGCANNALSPQEKALEFMLFDLSGCITPPDQGAGGVMPPPTK
ncbi:MAG TPA: hypothetical protein VK762_14475 [Polyangiaceae bacterium]|nr:hypothetical protein [Polyangiaceae bacterium]